MFWSALVLTVLLLGGAYVIWVLAQKESGKIKTTGNVLAILITVIAAVVLIYSGIGGATGRGRMLMAKGHMGMSYSKGMMSQKMMNKYISRCSVEDARLLMEKIQERQDLMNSGDANQ